MNIVYDNDGFVRYATPFAVAEGEKSTTVKLPTDLVKPKFVKGKWVEGITAEELAEKKAKKVAELREEYSKKIDTLVAVYVQKKAIDGTEIPSEILEAREALKSEYHEKVDSL